LDFLRSQSARAVLEIGNVLNHYAYFQHTVVDKYEAGDGVTNVDVCDFKPTQKYDAIVSISTIEHVGWDEEPFDPEKAIHSIRRLRKMLAPGGRMLVSVPIGHNSEIDRAIRNGDLDCTDLRGMKRIGGNNWVEVPLREFVECRLKPSYRRSYDQYRRAEAVAFAYF
jgi:SAM-dependent methyltransferase